MLTESHAAGNVVDAVTTGTTTAADAATGGSGSEMPDIPPFLKRDQDEIIYAHIKQKWAESGAQDLLLSVEPTTRLRFLKEYLMPALFPGATVSAAAEEVLP
jgi:hypothetical protein